MWSRSIPSSMPSSTTCRSSASSRSGASKSEALSSDRRLDWCATCRAVGGPAAVEGVTRGGRANDSTPLLLDSLERCCLLLRSWLRLLLRPSAVRGVSSEVRAPCGAEASLKLNSRTRSMTSLSRSSSGRLLLRSLGMTLSPGLYIFAMSAFSCSDLPLSGFIFMYCSRIVLIHACLVVARTGARHEGHVYGWMLVAVDACWANHSFRQEPQKVCRQSRRAKGW